MLVELQVRDLGVIEHAVVDLGPGMTALTGETGAGKTLVVEALELLLGGRADPVLVRPGSAEALVEGRFLLDPAGPMGNGSHGGEEEDHSERILARALPAGGRSRAWVDGHMAPVSALAEAGGRLVDLHGQHSQQSLLDATSQRRALDLFAGIDTSTLDAFHLSLRQLHEKLERLGGDERARARQCDLLRHQLAEIEAAGFSDPHEDDDLAGEEERLADAAAYRQAATTALIALDGADDPSGAVDRIGEATAAVAGRPALAAIARRLEGLQADAADVASELRAVIDGWDDDPDRLAEVRARRQLLRDLSRKYGDGVEGIVAFAHQAQADLADLESAEARAAEVAEELDRTAAAIAKEEAVVGKARRKAAPKLAKAVEARLRALAMPKARIEIAVGPADPGEDVSFLLGANPGEPALALSKVASGGELARAMLALRLVLSEAPPTMVFDEVDAGVGGEAALAVGRALAELAERHQVVVVTHLPQVAAFAHRQLVVRKDVVDGRTVASVSAVFGEERVVELARMLSGRPDSQSARRHAEELLSAAGEGVLHR